MLENLGCALSVTLGFSEGFLPPEITDSLFCVPPRACEVGGQCWDMGGAGGGLAGTHPTPRVIPTPLSFLCCCSHGNNPAAPTERSTSNEDQSGEQGAHPIQGKVGALRDGTPIPPEVSLLKEEE